MNGRWVAIGLVGGAAVFAALFWKIGLDVAAEVTKQAESQGVPKLSREEAASRAARDDMFGLPSRLPNAPDRDIERAWTMGTVDQPFDATAEGVEQLFDVYAVSVKGCRAQLPSPEKDSADLPIFVTLKSVDGRGRVVEIDGPGEGSRTRAFTHCLVGSVRPAVFEPPANGELTLGHRLALP